MISSSSARKSFWGSCLFSWSDKHNCQFNIEHQRYFNYLDSFENLNSNGSDHSWGGNGSKISSFLEVQSTENIEYKPSVLYEVNLWTKCSVLRSPCHFMISFLCFGIYNNHCWMLFLCFTHFKARHLRFATLVRLFDWTLACMSSFRTTHEHCLHVSVCQPGWTSVMDLMDHCLYVVVVVVSQAFSK